MGGGRGRCDEPSTFSGYCVCVASYFIILALVMTNARQTQVTWWQSVDTLPVTDWAFGVYNLNEPLSTGSTSHCTSDRLKRIDGLL